MTDNNQIPETSLPGITLPQRDPIAAYARSVTAARRVAGKQCACGESRPQALIPNSNPTICAECARNKQGHNAMDNHHPGMKTNNPLTVPIPVNDHRAELSVAQDDWPKETRENPNGCPLLAAAGCIRGFVDWLIYIIKKSVLWIPEMLEILSKFLADTRGPKWAVGTPLERSVPQP